MKKSFLPVVLVSLGLVMGAPGAFAFTIVTPGSGGSAGVNLTDPDQKTDNLADQYQSGRGSTMPFGDGSLQFNVSHPDNSASSANDLFMANPASHTVPSANFPGAN
jgi:hypothetical protein